MRIENRAALELATQVGGIFSPTNPNRPLNHTIELARDVGGVGFGEFRTKKSSGATGSYQPPNDKNFEDTLYDSQQHNRAHKEQLSDTTLRETNAELPEALRDPAHG